MWWWIIGGYVVLAVLVLRSNYVLGGINKQIDEAAKKYFEELEKSKDQQWVK